MSGSLTWIRAPGTTVKVPESGGGATVCHVRAEVGSDLPRWPDFRSAVAAAGLQRHAVAPLGLRSAEQDAIAAAARNRTRIAATVIQDELGALRGRLFLLAGGLSMQTSDLNEFHDRAKAAFGGMPVILNEPDQQRNRQYQFPVWGGASERRRSGRHPSGGHPTAAAYRGPAARSDHPSAGHYHQCPGHPGQPVGLCAVLGHHIYAAAEILGELDIPKGWIAAIFDQQGYQIGRSIDPEPYLGQLARDEFIRHMNSEDEGWVPGVSREGIPVFNAFVHTRLANWVVVVAIPRDILLAPVRRTTRSLLLLGGAIVALAVVMAIIIGRRIAAPVIGLVPIAEAVGRGQQVSAQLTWLSEANVVANSPHDAGERLRLAAMEREASTAALSQSEQMYRALAEDLAKVDNERNALLTRVVVAQETERQRIAREMHDSLAQYLAAIRLKLDTLGRSGAPTCDVVAELRSMIDELGRSMTRMAWELRPVALDNLGLHSAVDHYLEEWAEMAQLQVDVQIDLCGRSLSPAIEATLFRVLQEATTNVLRHANATRVGVILKTKDDLVQLIVEDNGKGFPVDDGRWPFASTRKFGLHGMRERLALVHGQLDVESSPQAGTTLFVSIPLGRVALGQGLEAS